ncbi:MAG: DUF58 domain-containing protein [Candidatus Acidiferrales bacterium]
MTEALPLTPPPAVARAGPVGRFSFGFAPRFFVMLLLGLVWLGPAWWFHQCIEAMLLWDALALAVWIWDLGRLPRPDQVEVRRIWRTRPALGVPAEVSIELQNAGKRGFRARVVDETPLALRLDPPSIELKIRAHASASAAYPILPAERGDARLGRTFVRYQSGLRFAERWAVAATAQTVCVLPNLEQAKRHTLLLIRSRQVELEKRRRRQRGTGREFDGLREYREGDELRDISWTATARRNHLITRVFQIERSQAIWLVLDAGRLLRAQVEEPVHGQRFSKLDYSVNAALSLAQVALYRGDRVGLVAYGRRVQQQLNAGRGQHQLRAIVESLARVHAEPSEADHGRAVRALLQAQKRRGLIVWITDFAETPTIPEVIEFAMQMAPRHLVVFAAMGQPDLAKVALTTPDSKEQMYRHVAALEISERRDLLLRGLRERGVLARELMPGMLASALVNQYLEIKERSML